MFSNLLKSERTRSSLSLNRLSELLGVRVNTLRRYESGEAEPLFSEAESIMLAFGKDLVPLSAKPRFVSFDTCLLQPIRNSHVGREAAVKLAHASFDDFIESECAVENLGLSYGTVRTYIRGTTVDTGGTLSIWRLHELVQSASAEMEKASNPSDQPPQSVAVGHQLVSERPGIEDPVVRIIDFMLRATAAGADPAFTRYAAGARLVRHGYLWPYIPFKQQDRYERAMVALKRQNDGSFLVELLCESIEKV